MNKRLYKCIDYKVVETDEDKRTVTFYASIFNVKDADNDIILPGAFTVTLQKDIGRIKHLFNHNQTVGVIQDISEDSEGLIVRSKISRHTLANDVYFMYKDGEITEHSIGYEIIKSKLFDSDGNELIKSTQNYLYQYDLQKIEELKLWEVSSLNKWGANSETRTVDVKEQNEIEVIKNEIIELKKLKVLEEAKFLIESFTKKIKRILQ